MKKKSILLSVLLLFLFSIGCVSTGKKISVLDFIDQNNIGSKSHYNVIHNFKTESSIPQRKKGAIGKMFGAKESIKWEDVWTSKISEDELKSMWNDILTESQGTIANSKSPDYHFNIELEAVFTTSFIHSPGNIDFIGCSLFKLTVADKNMNVVHEKLFKNFGLWNANGMGGIKGPIEMGYSYPNLAIVKLGLYDVVSYIFQKSFLNNTSGGMEKTNHTLSDGNLQQLFSMLDPFPKDNNKRQYELKDTILAYSKYLMGEDYYSLEDLYNAYENDLLSQLWLEVDKDKMQILAKMAHQLKWPYFPSNLKPGDFKLILE